MWKKPVVAAVTVANIYLGVTTHDKSKKTKKNEKELKKLLVKVHTGKIDFDTIARLTIIELLNLNT